MSQPIYDLVGAAAAAPLLQPPQSSPFKLNLNAKEFVPNCCKSGIEDDVKFNELKRYFESLDEPQRRSKAPPQLTLVWKGFPKIERPRRQQQSRRTPLALATPIEDQMSSATTTKITKFAEGKTDEKSRIGIEEAQTKKSLPIDAKKFAAEEKRRLQALEALKLVEQRRTREPLVSVDDNITNSEANTKPIIHLSHAPVSYTAEEQERVNKLRIVKRERIERVLEEMRLEKEQQQEKTLQLVDQVGVVRPPPKRYISLQRAQQQQQEHQEKPQNDENSKPETMAKAGRFIPTNKQWDRQWRCRQDQPKDKENNRNVLRYIPPHLQTIQRSSSSASSNSLAEMRRGNINHNCCLSRVFSNWTTNNTTLSPFTAATTTAINVVATATGSTTITPMTRGRKKVLRYNMEKLLQLEPMPTELEKPQFKPELYKLSFMNIEDD